ncbi:pirin-like protein [Bordetella pertussis]|uniref:Quercetin 2,3-dioxygenase n=9 Tax=Bordetella TaxID=517 RepID=Q7VXX2_BORPE|nr:MULTISPECIES: pirin family protein [Bordetella]ETH44068.1 pirin family protein [Bordetella pertussis H939]ETH46733.1 pirin family protein [Bordetella pertussis H921]ETH69453.1 pirin family protein [Bordetella pertussis STO1-CHLA-0011]ETH84156.1 pirin family protein [Bordetella pertussis STO1-CHOC-0017]ETH87237.1 pirin family protein [Bordetella pertussis STO1-CHOC-0018]ETH90538.1 pirin family protein [Bordetella pertussis STO1-CHOC-0019]ETH99092.1 pirin family protein [Bordetella pertussi
MLTLRRSAERGHANHGWLDTHHTFSFANYYDPAHMGFGPLRVINDDRIAAGRGFGTHGHRDMEIITYVLDGAIAHKDSMGSGSTIRPGDVQRMSAGRGVMHSEFNPQPDAATHMLQIWIEPDVAGIAPEYEEKRFPEADKRGRLRQLVSPDGADGSLRIHQDARLYAGLFDGTESAELPLAAGRRSWVHVARGSLVVNGQRLGAGDGLALQDEAAVRLGDGEGAEVLVFDLP